MTKIIAEKGRYRVRALPSSRPNGDPLGFYVEVKRGRDWKELQFKVQRRDALNILTEKTGVRFI